MLLKSGDAGALVVALGWATEAAPAPTEAAAATGATATEGVEWDAGSG